MESRLKVFCNRCNITTNHSVKCEHVVHDTIDINDDDYKITHHIGTYSYQIIECNGCETISYRTEDYIPNFLDLDNSGKHVTSDKTFETYYPERFKDLLAEKKIAGVPFLIRKTYREIIDSYNFDQHILCAAGLRAIVEGICSHYSIDPRKTLKGRIHELSNQGLLSKELAESLEIHKLLGNYALHELNIPDKDELASAIHFTEMALETLFAVPERHQKLKEQITKRISKNKSK